MLTIAGGLIVTGCTDPPPTVDAKAEPCRRGTGSPISERALKRSLKAEGVRLYRDDRCYDDDALVSLSNITDAVPHEREDALYASEGHIFCDIAASDVFGTRIERFVWRNDPRPTRLNVLNVSCQIYPETREQTDRLERALRRLPGVSPRPTTVPSPDAVHD